MDIRHPVSAVIHTLEGPVLVALDRTTHPLSLAEVFRLVGKGSRSGVGKALDRLADSGVVTITGTPPRYELNRHHLAYPAVAMLAQLRASLFRRISETVAAWTSAPTLVGVYGSMARGDGDNDSDIDLLIVGFPSDDEVADLALGVERWTGNSAQIVVLSPDELAALRSGSEPIVREWDTDLIVVHGSVRQLDEVE